MDMIDRYLAAIARRLPADKATDIVAEIRDDLLTRIEVREDRQGRALDRNEISALIKDVGHPLIVAARYRPHQYLVGPDVYPFFEFSLRIALMLVAAWVIVSATLGIVFGNEPAMRAIGHAIGETWGGAFSAVGIVTVAFLVLERAGFPNDRLLKWQPEDLPAVADKQPSPWESALEITVGAACILWWVGLIHVPISTNIHGLRIDAAPIWAALWVPILALLVARLLLSLINLVRPRWKVVRTLLSVGTTVAALMLLALAYEAGRWTTVVAPSMDPGKLDGIQRSLDLAIRYAIVISGGVWVIQCGQELWRMWTHRTVR